MSQEQKTPDAQESNIISTYVARRLKAELIELANQNERTLSAEIRLALKRHVAMAKQDEVEDVA